MRKKLLLLFAVFGFAFTACGVYTFTGASISPDIKTVSVRNFTNRAAMVQPSVAIKLTELLKDRFISQTSLRLIDSDGDLAFDGYISDYRTAPISIQGTQTAALNRLTITISVKFTNAKDPKQNFDMPFSRYADYDSNKDLSTVESTLIDEINRQLVDDIFNKSVSNW